MATSVSHFALDSPLVLNTPRGEPLRVRGHDLALHRTDGQLTTAILTVEVTPAEFARIDREGLIHLERDARGPGAEAFEADRDVRIEARLDRDLLPALDALGGDVIVAGPAFLALEDSPLLESESWWAISVTKEVLRDAEGGSLREGFSTAHAEEERAALALPALALAADAFDVRNIEWHETADDEVLQADIDGENGSWECFVVYREALDRCTVYSQAPWATPAPQLQQMAELVTRINFGLPVGNFELDFGDGELRYKTAIDVSGARLTADLFENLLTANLSAMDAYLPALEAVRTGQLSPAEAVQLVEG